MHVISLTQALLNFIGLAYDKPGDTQVARYRWGIPTPFTPYLPAPSKIEVVNVKATTVIVQVDEGHTSAASLSFPQTSNVVSTPPAMAMPPSTSLPAISILSSSPPSVTQSIFTLSISTPPTPIMARPSLAPTSTTSSAPTSDIRHHFKDSMDKVYFDLVLPTVIYTLTVLGALISLCRRDGRRAMAPLITAVNELWHLNVAVNELYWDTLVYSTFYPVLYLLRAIQHGLRCLHEQALDMMDTGELFWEDRDVHFADLKAFCQEQVPILCSTLRNYLATVYSLGREHGPTYGMYLFQSVACCVLFVPVLVAQFLISTVAPVCQSIVEISARQVSEPDSTLKQTLNLIIGCLHNMLICVKHLCRWLFRTKCSELLSLNADFQEAMENLSKERNDLKAALDAFRISQLDKDHACNVLLHENAFFRERTEFYYNVALRIQLSNSHLCGYIRGCEEIPNYWNARWNNGVWCPQFRRDLQANVIPSLEPRSYQQFSTSFLELGRWQRRTQAFSGSSGIDRLLARPKSNVSPTRNIGLFDQVPSGAQAIEFWGADRIPRYTEPEFSCAGDRSC